MRTRTKVVAAAVPTLAVLLVVAFALLSGNDRVQATPPLTEKRLAAEVRLPNTQTVLRPTTATAAVSASAALEAIKEFEPIEGSEPITATLASVTNEAHGTRLADGSVDPLYKNVLAWVIEVPKTPLTPLGPAPVGDKAPPKVETRYCTKYFVVDATSGEPLFAHHGC